MIEVLPAPLLTPLLYLATAWACFVVARRGGLPSISLAGRWALLLLPLCFTGHALLSGQVYAPLDMALQQQPISAALETAHDGAHNLLASDIAFQIIPWHRAVRDAWAMGEWPLWNPWLLGGDVLAAAAQPAPYHPVNLLSLLLPLDLAMTFLASMFLFLAGLCAFLYARDLGCREESAFITAVGWEFSSFMAFWLLWPLGLTVAFTPLVFLAVRRLTREPGPGNVGWLAASFVLILLAGHPESVLYIVAAGAAYGAWELLSDYFESPGPASWRGLLEHARPPVAGAFVAGFLALAASAVFLLPLLEALPETAQYQLRHSQFAQQDHSVPLRQAIERLRANFIPFVHGVTWDKHGHVATSGFFVSPSSAYLGSVLWVPILFGLRHHPWRGRWLLAAFAGFGCLAGAAFPGVTHAIAALPLFDISVHRRWVFVAAFAMAVLAGLGAEAWAARKSRQTCNEMLALHGLVFFALATLLALSWPGMLRSGLSAEFLLPRCLSLLLPLLLSAALFAFESRTRRALLLLATLLIVQRTAEAGDRYPTLERQAFYPVPSILQSLDDEQAPFRIVALGGLLPPNIAGMYGLEDVRGYEPMALERYVETYRLWVDHNGAYFNRVDRLDDPFLDFLGVRYALATSDFQPDETWRRIAEHDDVQLLQNQQALERAFVPEFVQLERTLGAMWHQMKSAEDFAEQAWIHPRGLADDQLGQPGRGFRQRNGSGTVTLRQLGLGFEVTAEMSDTGWVVTSIPAWPGWRAEAVGEDRVTELPLAYANRAFLAFRLEAGEHRIRLRYRPESFVIGRAISVVALLAMAAWGFAWLRRRRSPRQQ